MKNKYGFTVQDRIIQDIEYAKNIKDEKSRAILATKALGAADFAVEFGLITYNQWEKYIEEVFNII
jgi:hypothetical protein